MNVSFSNACLMDLLNNQHLLLHFETTRRQNKNDDGDDHEDDIQKTRIRQPLMPYIRETSCFQINYKFISRKTDHKWGGNEYTTTMVIIMEERKQKRTTMINVVNILSNFFPSLITLQLITVLRCNSAEAINHTLLIRNTAFSVHFSASLLTRSWMKKRQSWRRRQKAHYRKLLISILTDSHLQTKR